MQRVWSTYLEKRTPSPSSDRMDSLRSRRGSVNSIYSSASTKPILSSLKMPSALSPREAPTGSTPFVSRTPISGSQTSLANKNDLSLSVNYLPSKFSNRLLTPGGARKRKNVTNKGVLEGVMPKRGGGVEAFRSGEARIPGENDEDYDGVSKGWFGGKGSTPGHSELRWNKFKWTLFAANVMLSIYSLVTTIFCLLTWFNIWRHADVVRVGNRPELLASTIAAAAGIITSLIGWAGILLNNRSFLAVYTLFLWICFALLVIPGYMTYKRRTFNLEGKINAQWSRQLGEGGRLRIQNELGCCGYFSPFVEATVSQTCYARSTLPGCKHAYLVFERFVLKRWYTVSFALVPLHIFVVVAGLLCSNHVTYRFGKGMMPKAYRLSMNSMAVIMDNYASQLAEQYGEEVATEALAQSRSTLQVDVVPRTFASGIRSLGGTHHKYNSLGNTAI